MFYGQTSPNLTFLLEITDPVSSWLKRRETFLHVISVQFKSSISDGMGVHKCIRYGCLHVLEGTMNAERYIKVSEQHMLPSRRRLFQGRPCVFKQDSSKPHTAAITTAWLHNRRVRVLNWSACSPDLSHIENIWCIIKQKIRPNSNTKTPETHNLDAQMSSNCFEKKRRCYTIVNTPPSQLF